MVHNLDILEARISHCIPKYPYVWMQPTYLNVSRIWLFIQFHASQIYWMPKCLSASLDGLNLAIISNFDQLELCCHFLFNLNFLLIPEELEEVLYTIGNVLEYDI